MTTAEKLLALAIERPNLTQTEAGQIVGVCRERVRQLTNKLALPFGRNARRRRVLALHDSGLHHSTIAILEGVTITRITEIIRDAGCSLRPFFKPCDWCRQLFETRQPVRSRWCSSRCKHNGHQHEWLVKTNGNLPCIRCGVKRAIAPWSPCPDHQRHLFQLRDLPTHCRQGHELTPDNIYQYGEQRQCRTCKRLWHRARKAVP